MVCRCGKRPEDEYNLLSGESNVSNPHSSTSLFDAEDDNILPL